MGFGNLSHIYHALVFILKLARYRFQLQLSWLYSQDNNWHKFEREFEAIQRYRSQALLPVKLCSNFNPHPQHSKIAFFSHNKLKLRCGGLGLNLGLNYRNFCDSSERIYLQTSFPFFIKSPSSTSMLGLCRTKSQCIDALFTPLR